MTASSKTKGILILSFKNHLIRRVFPSVPDPLQTIVSQATQVRSGLATEATRVTDQVNSLVSSATAAADHLVDQFLPQAVTVGTTEACFDFGHEKCYGFNFMQLLLWLCFGFFALACVFVILTYQHRRLSLHFIAFWFSIMAWVSSLLSAFTALFVYWVAEKARHVGGSSVKKGLVFDLAFAGVAVATIHLFLSSRALFSLHVD
ncbi:hypothetical protein NQ176_g7209 [Zarea fungicola]|uniref:Uncharacterized protein n=1 Tax=Zarea fungicola TaxID=93591 RepID=A0ACC1MZA1_9HYPO|nr:hypothetical protein NQ176_g7209 [Lecanicillium fungicola]